MHPPGCLGGTLLGGKKSVRLPQLRVTISAFLLDHNLPKSGLIALRIRFAQNNGQIILSTKHVDIKWILVFKLSLTETNTRLEVPVSRLSGGPNLRNYLRCL